MEPSFAKKFFIPQIKGRIVSYVVRESEPLDKLVKYVRTMCKKYGITLEDLRQILVEVKKESVEPFLDSSRTFYQPIRLVRFEKLCRELGIEVN
ncbi:MAG: hypothetical protein B6U76_01365 [Desulfurococcales archaeon ex4484_217_2]|nr:MAG: hypothetical protein B6U76_01365 [Desulfurococcales archaeon ex4484_217_2]